MSKLESGKTYEKTSLTNGNEWLDWNNQSGSTVQGFIKSELEDSVVDFEFDSASSKLIGLNAFNKPVCSTTVVNATPELSYEIKIHSVKVQGITYENENRNVTINYNPNQAVEVEYHIYSIAKLLATETYSNKTVTLKFYWEGTENITDSDNPFINTSCTVRVQANNKDTTSKLDSELAKKLFSIGFNNRRLCVRILDEDALGIEDTFAVNFSQMKIELFPPSNVLSINNEGTESSFTFNINGLNTYEGYNFLYVLALNTGTSTIKTESLSSTSQHTLNLTSGVYYILARIANSNGSVASDWIQANVISQTSATTDAMCVVAAIPTALNNCDTSVLYRLYTTDKKSGDITIKAYLGSTSSKAAASEFNTLDLTMTSSDSYIDRSYYTYVEESNVDSNTKKYLWLKIILNGTERYVPRLIVSKSGSVSSQDYFEMLINNPTANEFGQLTYEKGILPIVNFSQISKGTLFNDVNPLLGSSDGWVMDNDTVNNLSYSAYKVSGVKGGLFPTGYPLYSNTSTKASLLNSSDAKQEFSIEIVLKSKNISDEEDEIMSIGNLKFFPGHCRVFTTESDKNNAGTDKYSVWESSRADYFKDQITHLLITYDTHYLPSTYEPFYNNLLNDYSKGSQPYPCLKIYVNGCINREIQLSANELLPNNKSVLTLEINPNKSDLYLYGFRTYNKALTYNQVLKNYISSLPKLLTKIDYYNDNNILDASGKISLEKCIKNHNIILMCHDSLDQYNMDKPLYWNNKYGNNGKDGSTGKASILIHYADDTYKSYNGKFIGGKLKAQGTSAKKYLFHNIGLKGFSFIPEQWDENLYGPQAESINYIKMPGNDLKIKSVVGKINYASSMLSHKLGACKLYSDLYEKIAILGDLTNMADLTGGKKAVDEQAFLYFYIKDENPKDMTWEKAYATAQFVGFLTFGSAKKDKATSGFNDSTKEFLMLEGADNGNLGANFKVPWAAYQRWNSKDEARQRERNETIASYTDGLLIDDETIKYNTGTTKAWDVDFGFNEAENDFSDEVKLYTLSKFAEFSNLVYLFDYSNYLFLNINEADSGEGQYIKSLFKNPDSGNPLFILDSDHGLSKYKLVFLNGLLANDGTTINEGDVLRYDSYESKWVPAGLHYRNNSWERLNYYRLYEELIDIYNGNDITPTYLDPNLKVIISKLFSLNDCFTKIGGGSEYIYFEGENTTISDYKCGMLDLFKAACTEYLDVDDVAFHQAFIRLVSGTDNRAKNTYFVITGVPYKNGIRPENPDPKYYKIRLYLDDLDTIFATDNNGQQVKPYNLLEPPFNRNTEGMWGDLHSGLFYNFDMTFEDKINKYLKLIIEHTLGGGAFDSQNSLITKYFLSIQDSFPNITYNHAAEIQYELALTVFLKQRTPFGLSSLLSWDKDSFVNNSVAYPLSLSHGSAIESEKQFLKDRFSFLGSLVKEGKIGDGNGINLLSASGSAGSALNFRAKASFNHYIYPYIGSTAEGVSDIEHIVNQDYTDVREAGILDFDPVLQHIDRDQKNSTVLKQSAKDSIYEVIYDKTDTLTGASLPMEDMYSSVEILAGLDYVNTLLPFKNANRFKVDNTKSYSDKNEISRSPNYTLRDKIVVSNSLPSIEELSLIGVINTSGNTIFDLRNCNRLTTLDLTGCSGYKEVILPLSSLLREVTLPSSITSLRIERYPDLLPINFKFDGSVSISNLSLDCSNDYALIQHILTNFLSGNADYVELFNIPEEGIWLPNILVTKLAKAKLTKIRGKIYITTTPVGIASESNREEIAWTDKKLYAQAWGNIDNNSNPLRLYYKSVPINNVTIRQTALVASVQSDPTGLQMDGNNVVITGNRLDITYSGGTQGIATVTSTTGVVTPVEGASGEILIRVSVNTTGGTKTAVAQNSSNTFCKVKIGFRAPKPGDFAYTDGHFDDYYDSTEDLAGIVFYVEEENGVYDVRVLGTKQLSGIQGPSTVDPLYWYLSSSYKSTIDAIKAFATSNGMSLNDLCNPASDFDLGIMKAYYTGSMASITTASINVVKEWKKPQKGLDINNTYVNAAKNIYNKLRAFPNSITELPEKIETESSFDRALAILSNVKLNNIGTNENMLCLVFPAYYKASLYLPESERLNDVYKAGKWYIPSMDELSILLLERVTSVATNSDTTSLCTSTAFDKTITPTVNNPYPIFAALTKSLGNASRVVDLSEFFKLNYFVSCNVYGSNNSAAGDVTSYSYNDDSSTGNFSWKSGVQSYSTNSCNRLSSISFVPCCLVTIVNTTSNS